MGPARAALLSAFDEAVAAIRGLEANGLRTASGEPAGPLLQKLRTDLESRRTELAAGGPFDRDWAGGVVRWVAEWVPEDHLPLIARLGQLVRLGGGK